MVLFQLDLARRERSVGRGYVGYDVGTKNDGFGNGIRTGPSLAPRKRHFSSTDFSEPAENQKIHNRSETNAYGDEQAEHVNLQNSVLKCLVYF